MNIREWWLEHKKTKKTESARRVDLAVELYMELLHGGDDDSLTKRGQDAITALASRSEMREFIARTTNLPSRNTSVSEVSTT